MATIALYFLMVSYIIFIAACFILTSGKKEETFECYAYRNGKIEYEGRCTMSEAIENGWMMTSEDF